MRPLAVALALLAGIALAAPARAGTSAQIFESVTDAPTLDMDPSIRSVGMGGASAAVFWGVDPSCWANPALLGYANGIRYDEGATNLYGLGTFLAQRTTLGYGGLGFAGAGQPFDAIGQLELSFPNMLGSGISSSERVTSWAAGVSVAGVSASIARLRGRAAPEFTRYVDLSLGYGENTVEDVMTGGWAPVPGVPPQPVTVGHGVAKDWGLLARGAVPVRLGGAASGRVEGAYAFAAQNFTNAGMEMFGLGISPPMGQDFRNGVALHLALDPTAHWNAWLPAWFARGLEPLVSLGGAFDAEHTTRGFAVPGGQDVRRLGGELGLANVVFARMGYSKYGSQVDTWGIGIGLPLGRFGGYRYDHAVTHPTSPFSEDLERDSWTAWLDPVEIYRALRH